MNSHETSALRLFGIFINHILLNLDLVYRLIFIRENHRNVLEVTKIMSSEKFKLSLNYFLNSSLKFLSEYFLYILLLVFQPVTYSGSSKKH